MNHVKRLGRKMAGSALVLIALAASAAAAPVSYWNFNDGATVTDLVGGNNALSISGATFTGDAPTGGGAFALNLTNGNDIVSLPSTTYGITNAYTISAWVKTSSTTGRFFSIKRDLTAGGVDRSGVNLGLAGGNVYTGLISNPANPANNGTNTGTDTFHDYTTSGTSVSPITNGVWTHVAATLANDKITMYVNGIAETTYTLDAAAVGTLATPAGYLKVSGRNIDFNDADGSFSGLGADGSSSVAGFATSYYHGLLDEVAVWNSALTPGEIRQLAAGLSPTGVRPGTQSALDLSSVFDRDTIANTANEPTGNGYRSASEVFLTNNHPSQVGGDNLPTSGKLTAGGVNFELGPYGDSQVTNNTWVFGVGANAKTASVDVPDQALVQASVLFSGVGYTQGATLPQNETDGTFTVFYTDGSSESFVWDVADSDGAGFDGLAQLALDNADLFDVDTQSVLASNRNLYLQTFGLNPLKVVDRFQFSTVGVVDQGGSDAQFGIYAITVAAVPEPGAMLLWSALAVLMGGTLGWNRWRRGAAAAS